MNSPSRVFLVERKKENRKVSELRVDLEGGCGNQLFQFFAAYSISRSKDVNLVVNTFKVNQNRHKGFCISQSSYLRNLNGVRFVTEQPRDSNRIREKLSVHLGTKYKPNEIGMPKKLPNTRRVRKVSGYFQTEFFFRQLLNERLINLEALKRDFEASSDMSKFHEIDFTNSIVIHVRGGDYRNQKNSIGCLSIDYFTGVLSNLGYAEDQIYIISDEAEEVIANKVKSRIPYRYLETQHLHPLAIIALISRFSFSVISNSTLSLWGAMLQDRNQVIAPAPWFKGLPEPLGLVPELWKKNSSIWED